MNGTMEMQKAKKERAIKREEQSLYGPPVVLCYLTFTVTESTKYVSEFLELFMTVSTPKEYVNSPVFDLVLSFTTIGPVLLIAPWR